jgi:uncharacterized protein Veg
LWVISAASVSAASANVCLSAEIHRTVTYALLEHHTDCAAVAVLATQCARWRKDAETSQQARFSVDSHVGKAVLLGLALGMKRDTVRRQVVEQRSSLRRTLGGCVKMAAWLRGRTVQCDALLQRPEEVLQQDLWKTWAR